MIGIGIDTGGTYTDAVVYDTETQQVLSSGKALTTKEKLETGITAALDQLDEKYLPQVKMLALSTTLATNACLEDKGSRARLLMIGMSPQTMLNVDEVYAKYGFRDLDQLIFVEGKPENIFSEPEEPDWERLKENMPEQFGDCAAVGICQIYPEADGGKLEEKAKAVFLKNRKISVTTAHDMFVEVDPLKRGAGALLNARLVPLIAEFLRAVKRVMKEKGLHVPVAIVRSDGSLMSETMAKEFPVETLLSGPAASVVGGSLMAGVDDALIVDMGGTTTDVAIVKGGVPLAAQKGISIGKWRTTVQGLYVDTFLLGGDSAVRYREHQLFLDSGRVIPLSVLYQQHPEILRKLLVLTEEKRMHTRMLHEFYVLQKDISRKRGFTPTERKICSVLKKGPMTLEELAEAAKLDLYTMDTRRLEEEGVLMKSGLTPTDMMVLKGDFPIYDPAAARAALRYVAWNIGKRPEEIPDLVYDAAVKKLYCNLVRILLEQKYPAGLRIISDENVRSFIEWAYEEAAGGKDPEWISVPFRCELPIVGVGAPIHIFLPRVAKLLGTTCIIRENAPVANALGAIASQIVTRVQVRVKAEYEGSTLMGYSVYEETVRRMFDDYDEAEAFAKRHAEKIVREKARKQGAGAHPKLEIYVHKIGRETFFESIVGAVITDNFQL